MYIDRHVIIMIREMTKPPLMTSEENKNKYSQICAWMVRTI